MWVFRLKACGVSKASPLRLARPATSPALLSLCYLCPTLRPYVSPAVTSHAQACFVYMQPSPWAKTFRGPLSHPQTSAEFPCATPSSPALFPANSHWFGIPKPQCVGALYSSCSPVSALMSGEYSRQRAGAIVAYVPDSLSLRNCGLARLLSHD